MNLPNFLTIARIFLVPVIVWLLVSGSYFPALLVFCLAAASDAIDGWLARWLSLQTEIGAHLDPLADKLLLVSCFAALGMSKLLPAWLVITVISRDIFILGGLMLSWFMNNPVAVRPLPVSKLNTLTQILFLVLVLYDLAFSILAPVAVAYFGLVVCAITLISGLAYVQTWFAHMNGPGHD